MNTNSINISAQNISLLFPKNIKSDYLFNDIISVLPPETELETTASVQIPFDSVLNAMKSDNSTQTAPVEKELLGQKLLSSLDSEDDSDLTGINYFMVPQSVLYELTNNPNELPANLDIENVNVNPNDSNPESPQITTASEPNEKLFNENGENNFASIPSGFEEGEAISINYGGVKYRMEIVSGEEVKLLIDKINEKKNSVSSPNNLIREDEDIVIVKNITSETKESNKPAKNIIDINKVIDIENNETTNAYKGYPVNNESSNKKAIKSNISNDFSKTIKSKTDVNTNIVSGESGKVPSAVLKSSSTKKPENPNLVVISKEQPALPTSKDLSQNNSAEIEFPNNLKSDLQRKVANFSAASEKEIVLAQNKKTAIEQEPKAVNINNIPKTADTEAKVSAIDNFEIIGNKKTEIIPEKKVNVKLASGNPEKSELFENRKNREAKVEIPFPKKNISSHTLKTVAEEKSSEISTVKTEFSKDIKTEMPKIVSLRDSAAPELKITNEETEIEKKSTAKLQNKVISNAAAGNKEIENPKITDTNIAKEIARGTKIAPNEIKIIYHPDRTPTIIEKIESFEKIGNIEGWDSPADKSTTELNPKANVNPELTKKTIESSIYKVKTTKQPEREEFAFIKLVPDEKVSESLNHPFLGIKGNNGISLDELNKFNLRIDNVLSQNSGEQIAKTSSELKQNNLEIFQIDRPMNVAKASVFPLENILTKTTKNEVSKKDEKRSNNVLPVDKKSEVNLVNQLQPKTDKSESKGLTGDPPLNTVQKSDQSDNLTKTGNFEHLIRNNMQGNGEASEIIKNTSMQMPKAETTKFVNFNDTPAELTKLVASGKSGSVELRINPKELGSVKILIDISHNIVNARVDVENEAVRNLIASNITQLKEVMQQSGFVLNQFNINYQSNNSRSKAKNNSSVKNGKIEKIDNLEDFNSDEAAPVTKNMGYNSFDYLA